MKAIDRRRRRLEDSLAPREEEQGESLAELLRERRRRRLEASGEPFEVRPCERLTDDQIRHLSIADILRMGRSARRSVARAADRIASDGSEGPQFRIRQDSGTESLSTSASSRS